MKVRLDSSASTKGRSVYENGVNPVNRHVKPDSNLLPKPGSRKLPQIYYLPFTSRVREVLRGKLPTGMNDQIDKFEETHSSDIVQGIGAGLFAQAYLFKNYPCVIKESFRDEVSIRENANFTNEAKSLERACDIPNSQKLVAQVKTEKGNYYLISTFVEGKKPDPKENPFSGRQLKSLFQTFLHLDKSGIYHNDLNIGNCLINKDGKIALIDYQFSDLINYSDASYNDKEFQFPPFIFPANVQMFEMANLPFYISKFNNGISTKEIRSFFKEYLNEKSTYHRSRTDFLGKQSKNSKNITGDAIKYERLMSKFLQNPSEEMINLQALKLQMFYAFRNTFSVVDLNNKEKSNPVSGVPLYFYTAACAKKFVDYAEKMKTSSYGSNNREMKELLDYEIKLGNYWRKNMIDGGTGTFNWIYRTATGYPLSADDDATARLLKRLPEGIGCIDDVAERINGKTTNNSSRRLYHLVDQTIQSEYSTIANKINALEGIAVPEDKRYEKELEDIKDLNDSFIKAFSASYNSLNDGQILVSPTMHLLTIFYARLLSNKADKLYKEATNPAVYTYANKLKDVAKYVELNFPKTTDKVFARMKDTVSGNNYSLEYQLDTFKICDFDKMPGKGFQIGDNLRFSHD